MPKIRRSGQDWILDRFVASLGLDALMPGFMLFAASPVVGLNPADVRRIAERTSGKASLQKEYLRLANYRKAIAETAEEDGHTVTARRHFHLAALYFGLAQYLIQEDGSAHKEDLFEQVRACYAKVATYSSYPLKRVEIPFHDERPYDGTSFPGLLHVPPGEGPWPCVIFLPGTDMHKEQVPNPEDNIFIKRGLACLSIDGPGQGESLLRMLKVHVDTWNYERAVSAAIDFLETLPEIDSGAISVFGVSTGSYWSVRAALYEARNKDRLRASAGLMAQWESAFVTEFEYAQPAFKSNYMYMAGIDNEEEFDRQAALHGVDGIIAEVTCPVFVGQGEFDELCTPEQIEALIRQVRSSYEFRVYEDEFHPMGGVALEAWEAALDWIGERIQGKPAPWGVVRRLAGGGTTEIRTYEEGDELAGSAQRDGSGKQAGN